MSRVTLRGRRAGFVNIEFQLLMVVCAMVLGVIVIGVAEGIRAERFWSGAVGSLRKTFFMLAGAVFVLAVLYGGSAVYAVRRRFGKHDTDETPG